MNLTTQFMDADEIHMVLSAAVAELEKARMREALGDTASTDEWYRITDAKTLSARVREWETRVEDLMIQLERIENNGREHTIDLEYADMPTSRESTKIIETVMCVVCMESTTKDRVLCDTYCGHVFHAKCRTKQTVSLHECPVCRGTLDIFATYLLRRRLASIM